MEVSWKIVKDKGEHIYTKFWEVDGNRIIECQSCGFKHVAKLPDKDQVKKFYQNLYYNDIKPVNYGDVNENVIKYYKNYAQSNQTYIKLYKKVNELLATDKKIMLDIGGGNDLLAYYFLLQGWQSFVVEPSKDASDYLKRYGLKVYNQRIEEFKELPVKQISFVNLQFVLEHLTNPYEVIKLIYDDMAPGGIFRVCVPNDFSEGQLAYLEKHQGKMGWVCLPDHINYFSFDSLSALLTRAGFQEVYKTTNFPLEFLLMGGMDYYQTDEEKKKVGPFLSNFESCLRDTGRAQLLETLYETLAQQGFGRSIFMYAIKPLV